MCPALKAAGYSVRRSSRSPSRARARFGGDDWVELDVDKPETLAEAMEGCSAAVYLVHSVATSSDYPEREALAATAFCAAARTAGVRRIVYLGGTRPEGRPSRHLASRLRTGAILREQFESTIELRAGLIIGVGGSSWYMVRDLANRLPVMVLPQWLRHSSWPIGIDDVVLAIVSAVGSDGRGSAAYDLPGSERIEHRDLIRHVASALGKHPLLFGVPVVSPRLSSHWIALTTRATLAFAQELVEGLRSNLEPTLPPFWNTHPGLAAESLESVVRHAVDDEKGSFPSLHALQRIRARLHSCGLREP